MNALRIGTRGSDLALQQARAVASALERCGAAPCELRVIRTSGDRIETGVLSEFGGKGLFVKEIEEALSGNEIDIAVHSAKDLPVVVPSGLIVQGYLPREDARDGFVLPRGVTIRTP
ncbi:MAG: hydroxymethylbilane synthase, partial [Acidobacteriota bacterium]|nr:hydroxymethylbilane synthase [Acidobacteriota bacterium]